jgi:non-specific serine/threonine protein kinase
VGKTRLAGEVAARVAGRFADGVWLAELAAVGDPAQVPAVVAVALGVREQPGVPLEETLARVLARQQVLLVLDNCEHVIGAAAELCAEVLAAADDVRILATSRERLRVAGEACYRLGPLALSGPGDGVGAAGGEAVALFADRAHRADGHFALTEQDGPVVARLVARLDGMPLAIELAATPPHTSMRPSRSHCGPTCTENCSPFWTAVACCAPRPAAPLRPSPSGPRSLR